MLKRRHFSTLAVVMALALIAGGSPPARAAEPAEKPASPNSGFRADYLMEIARLRERTLLLAGEIPPESYGQAAGGHTLGECLTDMAAASRRILHGMDHEGPPAAGRDDAVGKAEVAPEAGRRVVEDLTVTLDAVRRAVEATPEAGLGAPIDFLGRRWTARALLLLLLGQMHEGLGHAAAHAESLGIVPPWVQQKRVGDADED